MCEFPLCGIKVLSYLFPVVVLFSQAQWFPWKQPMTCWTSSVCTATKTLSRKGARWRRTQWVLSERQQTAEWNTGLRCVSLLTPGGGRKGDEEAEGNGVQGNQVERKQQRREDLQPAAWERHPVLLCCDQRHGEGTEANTQVHLSPGLVQENSQLFVSCSMEPTAGPSACIQTCWTTGSQVSPSRHCTVTTSHLVFILGLSVSSDKTTFINK